MRVGLRFAAGAFALPVVQAAVLDRSVSSQCTPYKCILSWSEAPAWCASQSMAHSTCSSTTTTTTTTIVRTPTCMKIATSVVTVKTTATAPMAVTATVQSTATVTSTSVTTTTVAGVATDAYATCTQKLSFPAKRAAYAEPRHPREIEEQRRSLPLPSCLLGLAWSQCDQACRCGGWHGSGCGSTVTQTCTVFKPATTCATSTRVSTTTLTTTTTVSTTVTTTAVATITTVTTSTSIEITPATPTNRFYIQAQLGDDAPGTSSGFMGTTTTGDPPQVDLEPFSASLQSWSLNVAAIRGAGSMNAPADPATVWTYFVPQTSTPIYTQEGFLLDILTCSITNCILSCTGPNSNGATSNTVYFDEAGDSMFIAGPTTNNAQATTLTMHIITYSALAGS